MPLTPLELPSWVEFNTWRTGLKEHRFSIAHGGAEIRAIFYLDRRGRLKLPPTNAYIPVVFLSERRRPSGRTAQWLDVAAPLVEEMARRGFANQVRLPPEVDDVRPWQWSNFLVRVFYTYCLDFPLDTRFVDPEARRLADKAARLGLTVEMVADIDPVMECLAQTERRNGFSYGIDAREMRVAQSLLGADSLRMYVCFDHEGRPAASTVFLHAPGARAIEWIAGTSRSRLTDGASCLLFRHSLDDLQAAGASGIDFGGANIQGVALFKSQWGARLVPTYSVRTYSIRAGARFLADWRASR
jgi:hypothetical protein